MTNTSQHLYSWPLFIFLKSQFKRRCPLRTINVPRRTWLISHMKTHIVTEYFHLNFPLLESSQLILQCWELVLICYRCTLFLIAILIYWTSSIMMHETYRWKWGIPLIVSISIADIFKGFLRQFRRMSRRVDVHADMEILNNFSHSP